MLAGEQPELDDVVGIRAAAVELKVSASTISRQVKAGIIPNRGTEKSPKVSIAEARRARAANVDPAQQHQVPTFTPIQHGFTSARTSHENVKRQLAEIELAKKLKEVCSKAGAEDLFATFGRRVRDALDQNWLTLGLELQNLSATEIIARGQASTEALLERVAGEIEAEWTKLDDDG